MEDSLKAGADPNLEGYDNESNRSILDITIINAIDVERKVLLLLQYGANPNYINTAYNSTSLSLLVELYFNGIVTKNIVDIMINDYHANPSLAVICFFSYRKLNRNIIRLFVNEYGATIELEEINTIEHAIFLFENKYDTVQKMLYKANNEEIVYYLINNGADPTIKNNEGLYFFKDEDEIREILIQRGYIFE